MKSETALADQERVAGTHRVHPWRCTDASATYCPIHHDCTCPHDGSRQLGVWPACPLHGKDTDHPTAIEVVR